MTMVRIMHDYLNLRIGDVVDVNEGVAQIYEQRQIAVRVDADEPQGLPEVMDRRVPGPREGKTK
jgi:hypothetical protein